MSSNYLSPVSWRNVRMEDGFWGNWTKLNKEVVLEHQYEMIEETGRLDNFRKAAGKKSGQFEGLFFNDSDVYKWLEAASYSLGSYPDKDLEEKVDNTIRKVKDAQEEDGYLNTYFSLQGEKRFSDLPRKHELYCAGHLIEAAVAHHLATGKKSLLNIATRFADLICSTFGPEKKEGAPGHEEIELALVKLYQLTRNSSYLDRAKFFIDERGKGLAGGDEYRQDHAPFIEQKEIVGHAVRATYLTSGAADVYRQIGGKAYMGTLTRLWENMSTGKMYVTGGIGSRYEGEAFGKNYELPNDRAYAETCAAIGSILWNHRMLQLTRDAKYADVMEKILYNGFLSGLSLDGREYFYPNPLRSDGSHRRTSWFTCACCPPNLARVLASLGGYFYSTSEDGIWTHLYGQGRVEVTLPGDRRVTLQQRTSYPWEGEVHMTVSISQRSLFTLLLRIPGWCEDAKVLVNGKPFPGEVRPSSYFPVNRTWESGDEVELIFPMPVRYLQAHPHTHNTARVALSRGPLIYCVEGEDHPGVDIFNILICPDAGFTPRFRPELLRGLTVLEGEALVRDISDWEGKLYRTCRKDERKNTEPVNLTAIPYFAWANRNPGKMQVWIPVRQSSS